MEVYEFPGSRGGLGTPLYELFRKSGLEGLGSYLGFFRANIGKAVPLLKLMFTEMETISGYNYVQILELYTNFSLNCLK